jgi:hypothetical protein
MKISMQPSLDWKVSILKISTKKKKLVSTDRDVSISIALDRRDPQAYILDEWAYFKLIDTLCVEFLVRSTDEKG